MRLSRAFKWFSVKAFICLKLYFSVFAVLFDTKCTNVRLLEGTRKRKNFFSYNKFHWSYISCLILFLEQTRIVPLLNHNVLQLNNQTLFLDLSKIHLH